MEGSGRYIEYVWVGSQQVILELRVVDVPVDNRRQVSSSKWLLPCHWNEVYRILQKAILKHLKTRQTDAKPRLIKGKFTQVAYEFKPFLASYQYILNKFKCSRTDPISALSSPDLEWLSMKPYHSMVVAAVIPMSSDTNMFGKMSSVTSPLLFDDSEDEYFLSCNLGINTDTPKKYNGETDSFRDGSSNLSRHYNVEDSQERDAQKHQLKRSIYSDTKSPPRTYDENNISYSPDQSSLKNQKYSWNSSLKSASNYCINNPDENIDANTQSNTDSQSQHHEEYSSPYFTINNEIKKPDSNYNTLSTSKLSIPKRDQHNSFQSKTDSDCESPRSFYKRLLPSPTNPNSDVSDNYFNSLGNFQHNKIPSKIASDSPSPETYYSHSSRSNSPKVVSGYFCGNTKNVLNTNNSNSYDIEANFSCNEDVVQSTDFSPDNIQKRLYCDNNNYTKHTNCSFNIQGNEGEIDSHPLLPANSSLWFRPTCKDNIIPSKLDSDSQSCDKSSKSKTCHTQSRSNESCTYEPELSSKKEQRKDISKNVYNSGCNKYSKQTKSSCKVQECEREIRSGSCLATNSSAVIGRTHFPSSSNIPVHNDADVSTSDDSFGEWPGTSQSRDIPDSGKTHNDEDSDSSLQLSNDSFGDFPLYNKETRLRTPVKEGGTFDNSFTQAALESHLCPSTSLSKWLYCDETAREYAAAASNSSRSKKKPSRKYKAPNKILKTRSKPKIAKPATRMVNSKLISSSESDDDFVFKTGENNPISSRSGSLDMPILKQMDVNSNHNSDGVKKKRKLFDGNMGDINKSLAKLKKGAAKEKRGKHKKSIEELICAGRDIAKTRRIDEFFKSKDNVDTSSTKYNVLMNDDNQCQNSSPKCENDIEAELLKISKGYIYTLNKRPLTGSASVSTITSEEKDDVAINRASNSSDNIVIVDNVDDTITPDIEGFSSKPVDYSMTGVSLKYLERKFFRNTRYLHDIFKGRQPCWRHEQYKIGGDARSELRYATATNAYTDEQINYLLNLLVKTFCHNSSTKFIDYFWKVLLPEIATKIFMEKFDLSHKESLQKIHDVFIVSKNNCKQAD